MLRLMHLEEIGELLSSFPEQVAGWLAALEKAFAASRLYQAGTIATLRGSLLTAERGELPAGISFRGKPTRSKILTAVASRAMAQGAEVAWSIIAEHRPALADAERVARQLAAAVTARGLIVPRVPGIGNTDYLRMIRRRIAGAGDLENAFVHLEGLVGPHDALVLFDRALEPHAALNPIPA